MKRDGKIGAGRLLPHRTRKNFTRTLTFVWKDGPQADGGVLKTFKEAIS